MHSYYFRHDELRVNQSLILNLLEREYFQHFDYIVIICSTLKWNKTYRNRKWIWTDNNIFLIIPNDNLYKILRGV